MPEPPTTERFKAEMPQIPGVTPAAGRRGSGISPALRLAGGLLAVLLIGIFVVQWLVRPKRTQSAQSEQAPQIDLPVPASEVNPVPEATESEPGIASVAELAQAWSSKDFFFRNRLSGENVPALVVRIPSGYWAFSLKSPYGNCHLEYITDLKKLASEYGFRAKHPMVGNPCSRTVFDPLRLTNLPGNVWVRGAIAQGSDLRPPLGIEVRIRGKDILATRME